MRSCSTCRWRRATGLPRLCFPVRSPRVMQLQFTASQSPRTDGPPARPPAAAAGGLAAGCWLACAPGLAVVRAVEPMLLGAAHRWATYMQSWQRTRFPTNSQPVPLRFSMPCAACSEPARLGKDKLRNLHACRNPLTIPDHPLVTPLITSWVSPVQRAGAAGQGEAAVCGAGPAAGRTGARRPAEPHRAGAQGAGRVPGRTAL